MKTGHQVMLRLDRIAWSARLTVCSSCWTHRSTACDAIYGRAFLWVDVPGVSDRPSPDPL